MEIQLCFVVMLLGGVISAGNDAFKSAERKTQIRNDIDDFINGVMDCYNLPGLSLSVVMNDEVGVIQLTASRDCVGLHNILAIFQTQYRNTSFLI